MRVWQLEKLPADSEVIRKFWEKFQKIIEEENFTLDQIYNCDETGLNVKMLPIKIITSQVEKAALGLTKFTALAAENSSGSYKQQLMVIFA